MKCGFYSVSPLTRGGDETWDRSRWFNFRNTVGKQSWTWPPATTTFCHRTASISLSFSALHLPEDQKPRHYLTGRAWRSTQFFHWKLFSPFYYTTPQSQPQVLEAPFLQLWTKDLPPAAITCKRTMLFLRVCRSVHKLSMDGPYDRIFCTVLFHIRASFIRASFPAGHSWLHHHPWKGSWSINSSLSLVLWRLPSCCIFAHLPTQAFTVTVFPEIHHTSQGIWASSFLVKRSPIHREEFWFTEDGKSSASIPSYPRQGKMRLHLPFNPVFPCRCSNSPIVICKVCTEDIPLPHIRKNYLTFF